MKHAYKVTIRKHSGETITVIVEATSEQKAAESAAILYCCVADKIQTIEKQPVESTNV